MHSDGYRVANIALDGRNGPFAVDTYHLPRISIRGGLQRLVLQIVNVRALAYRYIANTKVVPNRLRIRDCGIYQKTCSLKNPHPVLGLKNDDTIQYNTSEESFQGGTLSNT